MGIQGIYQELGKGQRVALSKLASDNLRDTGRPFRLAIDIAIWQFQVMAARGGVNPAIRTLFYRLVRLMGTPIQPIFVFDGPNKPAIKRNKRSGRGDGLAIGLAKRLIRLFGFVVHDAPGEAEAECALLQRHGIVDAVLSEDVDTIMFGCTKTLRNWSSEGKGSKAPTHVSLYDVADPSISSLGLDREGMVLVALMSGGDYLPDGIPGCGIKVAFQAAVAGYGKSICRLRASDTEGIRKWREGLIHELRTNESKFFRTRHKTLDVPDDFPNVEVLRYYTHPVVSQQETLQTVKQKLAQKKHIQLEALREFTRETFDWDYLGGAIKFIRVLGDAMLVERLQNSGSQAEDYVKRISTSRNHSTTDGATEMRLSYIPQEVVPIDISNEVEEEISYGRDGLALNSDDEFDEGTEGIEPSQAPKAKQYKPFDVTTPELAWVLEEVARRTVPQAVREWEDKEAAKAARKSPSKKKGSRSTAKKADMPYGSIKRFVRPTKASAVQDRAAQSSKTLASIEEPDLPPLSSITPLASESSLAPPPSKHSIDLPSGHSAAETISSSQDVPRTSTRAPGARRRQCAIPSSPPPQPEAIIISSSSPCEVPSPTASPTPRSRVAGSRAQAPTSPVRKDFAEGRTKKRIGTETSSRRLPAVSSPFASRSPFKSPSSHMKQTSMNAFVSPLPAPKLSRAGAARVPAFKQLEVLGEVSQQIEEIIDLTPDSPLTARKPSRRRPAETSSPSPERRPRKKLLIPVSGNEGFFGELEVDAADRSLVADRASKLLEKRGVKGKVYRLSDFTTIDLTSA